MESQWKRIEKPQQLKLIFGANLNILVSSVTLYSRAENNLPKSFKQLQGFTGFKTEIQVRNVLSFLSWTVYIWNNFRLYNRLNFAYVAKVNKIFCTAFYRLIFLKETLEAF